MELIERIEKAETELKELKSIAIRLASEKEEEKFNLKAGDYYVFIPDEKERIVKIVENEEHANNLNYLLSKKDSQYKVATPQEIEAYLLKEAEKKGFVKGARAKNRFNQSHTIQSVFYSNGEIGYVHSFGECRDIIDQCAEIIPSCPQIVINGHEAKFEDWGLDFNNGCAKIDKELFIRANDLINEGMLKGNKEITMITYGTGEFTAKEISLIAKHYDK